MTSTTPSLRLLALSAFSCAAFAATTVQGAESKAKPDVPKTGKVFEQTHGPWKAQCFIDQSGPDPYCKIMVVHFFNKSSQGMDFTQFGTAFDRDNTGLIVATYYGFANESHITVGIDGNPPINIPAPHQGNHVIAPPNITEELLKQMQTGTDIHVKFKLVMRGEKKLTYPLDGFRQLKVGVDQVMLGD